LIIIIDFHGATNQHASTRKRRVEKADNLAKDLQRDIHKRSQIADRIMESAWNVMRFAD